MVEPPVSPLDLERALADPRTYERVILRIFTQRRERGLAFTEAGRGVTYFDAAADRRRLAAAIARSVSAGHYRPRPVDLWFLETKGKVRAAHRADFTDHVVGSALYQLLSVNVRWQGLPGVYSYLPGMTNATAMRHLAAFVRSHRGLVGAHGPPLYVLQSDFDKYGDTLPVGPGAPLWPLLREVAALGSPNGELPEHIWDLIVALARPVVRNPDGTEFTRSHGVAMGTPLIPMLSNLAVAPMDRAVGDIEGIFYARYNDDVIVAHPDLDALHDADARIDALLTTLGVARKAAKERRTALSGNGMPAAGDPAYRGGNRIDCLGLSVSHAGTVTVGPHRLRRLVARIAGRLDGAGAGLGGLPATERARYLVNTANVMLDPSSPFAVSGLVALLDVTTDRGVLSDLDNRIARKIAQVATGLPGARGFRVVPPALLRGELGLASLVRQRNLR
jgi:hypothetical protein